MKTLQFLLAAMLFVFAGSAYADTTLEERVIQLEAEVGLLLDLLNNVNRGIDPSTGMDTITFSDIRMEIADGIVAEESIRICHVPPGNHMNAEVMLISQQAVRAHLKHSGESLDWLIADGSGLLPGEKCDAYQG